MNQGDSGLLLIDNGKAFALVKVEDLKTLLIVFLGSSTEIRNAAENTVCTYGCHDSWEDFKGHVPDCPFVLEWEAFKAYRDAIDFEKTALSMSIQPAKKFTCAELTCHNNVELTFKHRMACHNADWVERYCSDSCAAGRM